jgi:hypothetical protein
VIFLALAQLSQSPASRPQVGFVGCWTSVPFAAIVAVSLAYPVFQLKQFLFLVPPLLLGVALILPGFPRLFGGTVLIALLAFSVSQMNPAITKDNWRGGAAYIQERSMAGDLVYGNPAASLLALRLYWHSSLPSAGYPPDYDIIQGGWEGEQVTPEIADRVLRAATSQQARLWLVEFYPEFWDPQKHLETWLNGHAYLLDDQQFGMIRMRLFHMR